MARAPRLSLAPNLLRAGIRGLETALTTQRAVIDALASSDAEAQAAYLAVRGELSPWGRIAHPTARRARAARFDLSRAEREALELRLLQIKLRDALEKTS